MNMVGLSPAVRMIFRDQISAPEIRDREMLSVNKDLPSGPTWNCYLFFHRGYQVPRLTRFYEVKDKCLRLNVTQSTESRSTDLIRGLSRSTAFIWNLQLRAFCCSLPPTDAGVSFSFRVGKQ